MSKIIPHKKFLFSSILLCLSWLTFSQAIVITQDGPGICPGGKVTISTNDQTLVSYKWEFFRNGAWSAVPYQNEAKLSIAESGKYHLLAIDNDGKSRISNELNIIDLPAPPIPIIIPSRDVTQICQGDSLILKTAFKSGYLLFWSFNDAQLSIPQSVQIVAKNAGKYDLNLVDQSSSGCSAKSASFKLDFTSTITVKIDSVPPICNLSATPIKLVVTPAGGKFKGKGITDAENGTFNPSVAGVGKHEITYEVAQTGSCPSIADKRFISVSDLKPVITTNTGKTQFCVGSLTVLSAPSDMKKYEWFLGGKPSGNLKELSVGAGGDFQVKITDNEGCVASSPNVKIEFLNSASVLIEPIPSVCGLEYPPMPLKGTPAGGVFTIGGVIATSFDYKNLGFGKHTVRYTLNGSLPCLQCSAQQEVIIQDFPKPDLGPDILLGKGNSITLKGAIDGGITYVWSPTAGLDNPAVANPVASPAQTQEYMVKVFSSNGCVGEDKVNIVVYQPVYIPTAFTPNTDGNNDVWELRGLEVYPNPEVQIFNRWGNMVFYSKGIYAPFDGTDGNKYLPEGMYTYKINPFPDRPDFQYSGTFMLMR